MGFFSNYYMFVQQENDKILHLRRNPTWRSLLLFTILWGIVHLLSTQAQYPYLGYLCYILGLWFCYLATEKYEECIFNKENGTVTMMGARFLQRFTIGYNKRIVSQLDEVIAVTTESTKPNFLGTAHQVILLYITGLTLSITGSATYGNKQLHKDIANKINEFLQLAPSPFEQEEEPVEEDNNDKTSKKTN
ncbi:PREDICTED: uncharacterized protein C17orf62 homolog [Amphimedon queenslandica]|uniref:Essential for reactive oxygen species protein n=1 Tax=Amphimedon queenslandica TaxID=400682 RepID=A0A1X7V824_AMPQE|nr:PREDICTED: uncharacterized protein C17orf62 homolog [Amphimedon queenslandica]|eukprot:XP_011402994.1 PREDICTED: uncharacterized protein C17orf62 homolog [Amphimedon queenslandica]